ncbi:epoxide hydrolase [Globomyces pollinis-pini]|nr:epoxide hydrolase [Globomyces pollinis-pini]
MISDFEFPSFEVEIKSLKQRLANARLPGSHLKLENEWEDGVPVSALTSLLSYWKDTYDFDGFEKRIRRHPQFHTLVNGIDLHFVHKKSSDPNAIPILLIHGWPGSYLEFNEIVTQLSSSSDLQSFHVVVPSLPGYGFSSAPKERGFGCMEMAKTLHQLMIKLGYSKYIAQGGDWGSFISRAIAVSFPDSIIGIHLNMVVTLPPIVSFDTVKMLLAKLLGPKWVVSLGIMSRSDAAKLQNIESNLLHETGYQFIQATKPSTLGYSLSDSPIGLLSWIFEKFYTWGGSEKEKLVFTNEQILDHISLYWFTNCISSSIRLYKEHMGSVEVLTLGSAYCTVPTSCSIYPGDVAAVPMSLAQKGFNVVRWNEKNFGGHFAAMEDPEGLVDDIRKSVMWFKAGNKPKRSHLGWWFSSAVLVSVLLINYI